jgi:hypothetical protein
MPLSNSDSASIYVSLADDFYFIWAMGLSTDQNNKSLPFIMAHCIELVAKSFSLKAGNAPTTTGHSTITLLRSICEDAADLRPLLPEEACFENYKKFWIPGLATTAEISHIPPPRELDWWELAYVLDNTANLKYMLDRAYEPISLVNIQRPSHINLRFTDLFRFLRAPATPEEHNQSLKDKLLAALGKRQDIAAKFYQLAVNG